MKSSILVVLLGFVASTYAAALTLQSPKFTVSSPNGEQKRSEPISFTKKPSPVQLGPQDVLRISFQITEKENGAGVQPHQAFLRFYDDISGEDGVQPIRVATSGKAKFELNMARPPRSLPPTSPDSTLKVSLIVGSFVHTPLTVDLFDLIVPASQPVAPHPEEVRYHPQPAIEHTFRPEQKTPPAFISAVFSVLVLAPWVVLVGLWSQLSPKVPHLFSPKIVPFTATLGAFEVLLFLYWLDLKLGQVLLYGAGLGIVAVLTGKTALVQVGKLRKGSI
ncbi:hypothetical protein BDM02DRAFT_3257640 [Thelephora ganbajun]|uniref:Uncharacterized protein n=1 Tax=Thelephora ganbajun TaxID=370292 RepID=A0ACB6ZVW1_THEGA|nr:hypothetical protein BDM02DRAFT_3257640 [Thelephora ganbajun]